jgi:hypothetical protein
MAQQQLEQRELDDAADVQIQFVTGGQQSYEKSFEDHGVAADDDKEYVKDLIGQGADAE